MISVIVYGRNDAHGYNLHKRAALSLNCIAQVLTDPDDEIIFVDYNTPPEMPVFPEAIRDTLTDATLARLRVIRVPAELHSERYSSGTHLATLEPIARNVALRRSSPANRWILSTNTDMVFVPAGEQSLSDIAAGLAEAYWAIPRFQLPEALWERLDRRAPQAALETIGAWGRRLYLDEPITSYEWMGFDAPGDFQLVPREWLWALDGFDESMVLGWHVDSNLARRVSLAYGPPRDLHDKVRGYHCDHTRVPGVFHGGDPISNDAGKYVFDVEESDLPTQSQTWGLAGVELEEVDLATTIASRLPAALEAVLPESPEPIPPVDAREASSSFSYPASHVLPYVASALSVLPPDGVVAYVGANHELALPLASVLERLGFESPLRIIPTGRGFGDGAEYVSLADPWALARGVDAFVIDFGIPASLARVAMPTRISHWEHRERHALDLTFEVFDELTRLDVSGSDAARPHRSYVIVNAVYNMLEAPVESRLTGAGRQFTTRVRHGQARPRDVAEQPVVFPPRFGMAAVDPAKVRYTLGDYLDLGGPDPDPHLAGDWAQVVPEGTWADGPRAGFLLDVDPLMLDGLDDAVFTVVVEHACDSRWLAWREIDVEVADEHIARWRFEGQERDPSIVRATVPRALLRRERPIRIDLVIHDASPLGETDEGLATMTGVRVEGMCLDTRDVPLTVGDSVDFREDAIATQILWSGWSRAEADGAWTIGPTAVLRIPPVTSDEETLDLVVGLADVFVRPGQNPLLVEVAVDDTPFTTWSFAATGPSEHRIELEVRDAPTLVTLRMPAGVSCQTIGESDDPRLLGCRIVSVAIVPHELFAPAAELPPRRSFIRRALGRARRTLSHRQVG